MSASVVPTLRDKRRNLRSREPLDLSRATEQEIVAAFVDKGIEKNPPILPASIPAAIACNCKLVSAAMGVIEACQLGGDSRLAPLCAPGTVHPGLMDVLSVAHRMMSVIASNHAVMAQLYTKRIREEDRT